MDNPRIDFLAQYRAISSKLKKRFLRKPNVSEASAEFGILARELENQECSHYAAFCYLAVARCEHTIGNFVFETQNLHHAAKLFLEAENISRELLCPSYNEYLQAAITAFRECIKVFLDNDQPALAAAMYLELAEALKKFGKIKQCIPYILKASKLHRCVPLDYINDLKRVSDYCLLVVDYDGALSALTEVQIVAERGGSKSSGERIGAFTSILREVEVSRLLLLLYLDPPTERINPEHMKLLKRYSDDEADAVNYIEEELFLLLQSLVIGLQDQNEEALDFLSRSILVFLTVQQSDIYNKVINKYKLSRITCVRLNYEDYD